MEREISAQRLARPFVGVLLLLPAHRVHRGRERHPVGLRIGDMGGAQRALTERLIEEFVGNLRTELAGRIAPASGRRASKPSTSPGAARSSRVTRTTSGCTGPRLLVEHDNTQADANHVHSVW